MKRLGIVTSRHGRSCLVVKGESAESDSSFRLMNAQVIDKSVNRIGKVVTVFGSENQIYYLVRLFREIDDARVRGLVKEKVYIK